jgi:hypothetical protein
VAVAGGRDFVETWRMRSSNSLRGILSCFYWAVAFLVVFLFFRHASFCTELRGRNYTIMIARMAFALAAWNLVASFGAAMALAAPRKVVRLRRFIPLVSSLAVLYGLAGLSLLIHNGHGNFPFGQTWAYVRCFFTDLGNVLDFISDVAAPLTLATFLQEYAILLFSSKTKAEHDRQHLDG